MVSLTDRGEGKGAVLVLGWQIHDSSDGALYCRLRQTLLLRDDGGFGGPLEQRKETAMPDRAPDLIHRFATSPRATLIYRLSGDLNPPHLDPDVAAAAALSRVQGHDPADVSLLACRFSGVILPGDAIEFRIWRSGAAAARFAIHVCNRKVLDVREIIWRNA